LKNILEKKTRLQCIQEKHDYSTFWKKYDYNVTWKKLLAAHSGKTCFLTHSVKKHDCIWTWVYKLTVFVNKNFTVVQLIGHEIICLQDYSLYVS
jgi:hypothetical protein